MELTFLIIQAVVKKFPAFYATRRFITAFTKARPPYYYYYYYYYYFGIAIHYGLDGPGIKSLWGRNFLHPSRPALRPTKPSMRWVPGLSRE
jgi:hypothetical protein